MTDASDTTSPATGPKGPPSGPPVGMPDLPPDYVAKDYVDGPSSEAMFNLTFDYEYTIGNQYRLRFDDSFGVYFQMLNDGSEERGPLPYRCRELRTGQYLVHWLVRQHGIHVALVVDITEASITVGAMMPPGSWEFFDVAKDIRVTDNS